MHKNIQLTHSEHQAVDTKFPLTVVANDLNSPLNVGSLFRLSDALGIEKLYLCGDTPTPPNAKIKKTSRSTEKQVDYEYLPDAENIVSELKAAGSLIISLEITTASISISSDVFHTALKKQAAGLPYSWLGKDRGKRSVTFTIRYNSAYPYVWQQFINECYLSSQYRLF